MFRIMFPLDIFERSDLWEHLTECRGIDVQVFGSVYAPTRAETVFTQFA